MRTLLGATLRSFSILAVLALVGGTALAQQPPAAAFKVAVFHRESVDVSPSATVQVPPSGDQHKFWDKGNYLLFIAVAAASAADFAVTRSNLNKGGTELNPATRLFGRSTAGLAANFAGETAGVVGLSYFFHKTRHHKLERAVSFVDIGGSVTAVSYDLAHR